MKYIFGILGTIVALFVLVVFVFNTDDASTPQSNVEKVAQLTDYAEKNSNVSHTTIGKLVGTEERREIRIVVSPTERRLEIISGYDGDIISTQSYPNDKAAYQNFLSALGGQGFITSKKTSISDQRSVCPTGTRYVYDVSENGNHVINLWSVSCNRDGTFNGRAGTIRTLFQAQIPEYNRQVVNIRL